MWKPGSLIGHTNENSYYYIIIFAHNAWQKVRKHLWIQKVVKGPVFLRKHYTEICVSILFPLTIKFSQHREKTTKTKKARSTAGNPNNEKTKHNQLKGTLLFASDPPSTKMNKMRADENLVNNHNKCTNYRDGDN